MRSGVQGFQSERLLQLRTSASMTQTELANLAECAVSNISKWERGLSTPGAKSVQKLCSIFNVAEQWLMEAPISSPSSQTSFFRAQNQTPKASRDTAKIRLDWTEEISYKLQESLEFPAMNLPEYTGNPRTLTDCVIEDLATECRERWKLGQSPIENLVNSMEGHGIIVSRGTLGFMKMDGVSRWSQVDNRPYVFLCKDKENGFRSRFDAAHELGHIVLHKHITALDYQKNYALLEQQAHRFASALLLPAPTFSRDITYPTLDTFLALKPKWKVSVAAMISRCKDLELISEANTLRLWKARSARGWVQREPLDQTLPPESPKLLERSIKMLIENNILDRQNLRQALGMPANIIEELCNLPKNYMTQEDTDTNIIELRLRAPSTRRGKKPSYHRAGGEVVKF